MKAINFSSPSLCAVFNNIVKAHIVFGVFSDLKPVGHSDDWKDVKATVSNDMQEKLEVRKSNYNVLDTEFLHETLEDAVLYVKIAKAMGEEYVSQETLEKFEVLPVSERGYRPENFPELDESVVRKFYKTRYDYNMYRKDMLEIKRVMSELK